MNNAEACINSLDTYIDVLKEESVRLSNMITKLNDKIKEAETKKEQLIKEQNEPKFEIAEKEEYYFIDFLSRGSNLAVQKDINVNALGDKFRVDQNNCFKTKERAVEVADKINLLLKLERLHDIYSPNYTFNWGQNKWETKWHIYYDGNENRWCETRSACNRNLIDVYFPTEEIAKKVCNILNAEEHNEHNG